MIDPAAIHDENHNKKLKPIKIREMKSNKVELLAPAGNFEKLEIAIHYGADAVYLGGKDFSLRNFSGNFSLEEIKQAVVYAHDRGIKVYVTVNIYARNNEQPHIVEYSTLRPRLLDSRAHRRDFLQGIHQVQFCNFVKHLLLHQ